MSGFTINTVTLSGNLTRDPEVRSLPSGMSVTSLGLAVNERVKNGQTGEWEDRANFFDITVWGGVGEAVARECRKGSRVAVQGRLRWRQWATPEGQKRQAVDVVADAVTTMTGDGNGGARSASRDLPVDEGDFAPSAAGAPHHDEDIPF